MYNSPCKCVLGSSTAGFLGCGAEAGCAARGALCAPVHAKPRYHIRNLSCNMQRHCLHSVLYFLYGIFLHCHRNHLHQAKSLFISCQRLLRKAGRLDLFWTCESSRLAGHTACRHQGGFVPEVTRPGLLERPVRTIEHAAGQGHWGFTLHLVFRYLGRALPHLETEPEAWAPETPAPAPGRPAPAPAASGRAPAAAVPATATRAGSAPQSLTACHPLQPV